MRLAIIQIATFLIAIASPASVNLAEEHVTLNTGAESEMLIEDWMLKPLNVSSEETLTLENWMFGPLSPAAEEEPDLEDWMFIALR